jgi:RND family efflux transporter MFP subunit
MSYRSGILTGILFTLLVVGGGGAAWWLVMYQTAKAPKPEALPAPAKVPNPVKEDQINAIILTPEAIARLGLRTALVEEKPLQRTRVYGGEVAIPTGQAILVAAPLSGTLQAPSGGVPQPGQAVRKGQAVFQLLPLLTPEARANLAIAKIEADGQVKTAQTQVDAARIALDRARRVFESQAGSRRAVDEAQAQFDLAQKALEAAASRRDLLEKVAGEVEKGNAAPFDIPCPQDGLLRNVSARPGQSVPSGAALFEVVDLGRVWVRVPVQVGDLPYVDAAADATVGELMARPGDTSRTVKPVLAPPSADPAAGTVDLFYELDNRIATYSPGQRVAVTLRLKGEARGLTVPWSAVIHDIHGGTWVYEQTGERAFARRRVAVSHVAGDTAVLAAGPAPGTRIVVAGAAELFGTETGFPK